MMTHDELVAARNAKREAMRARGHECLRVVAERVKAAEPEAKTIIDDGVLGFVALRVDYSDNSWTVRCSEWGSSGTLMYSEGYGGKSLRETAKGGAPVEALARRLLDKIEGHRACKARIAADRASLANVCKQLQGLGLKGMYGSIASNGGLLDVRNLVPHVAVRAQVYSGGDIKMELNFTPECFDQALAMLQHLKFNNIITW